MSEQIEQVYKIETANYEVNVVRMVTSGKLRGSFEHNELGDECAGGLWFNEGDNGVTLIDYDGVFELPEEVAEALRGKGIVVPD